MFDEPFLLIGHRGAAGLEPENTLRSFQRAVELGVSAVELDVYVVDGTVVVIHDETVDRTTNGKGAVAGYSLAALKALDAGQGESVPSLVDVFAALPHEIGINVELKGPGTAAAVIDALANSGDDRAVLISSFHHEWLRDVRRLHLSIPIAPLYQRQSRTMYDIAEGLDAWSMNISRQMASREIIDKAHDQGYRVLVYTVNDPHEAQRLKDWGVDGLFTDRPDLIG